MNKGILQPFCRDIVLLTYSHVKPRSVGRLMRAPGSPPQIRSNHEQRFVLHVARQVRRHGARPKVLVYFDPNTGSVSTHPFPAGEPWLVKFQAGTEHPEVCAIEFLYAQLAQGFAIDMPETKLFKLNTRLSAFGIRRFDREHSMRLPILTLAGALDVDFRMSAMTPC